MLPVFLQKGVKIKRTFVFTKRIFIIGLVIFFSSRVYAQVPFFDEKTKEICNKVIVNIYKSILEAKDQYEELAGFDENTLYENKYGFYTISYQYQDPHLQESQEPYEFLVTITRIDDEPKRYPGFEDRHDKFPVLDLRLSSFIKRNRQWHFYNIERPIDKNTGALYEYQQEFLPLQLVLKTAKDTFQVNERIEFEVILENRSSQSFKVKNLTEETLFFKIDNKEWGTDPTLPQAGSPEVVLPAHDSIHRTFRGESFKRPGEIRIDCTYNLGYKGVLPFGTLKIKIVG